MRRNGRQSMVGELAGRFLDPLVPSRHVMDQHHARPRAGPQGAGIIGLANIAVMTAKRDGFRKHAFIGHVVITSIRG